MNQQNVKTRVRSIAVAAGALIVMAGLTACTMFHGGATPPPASEFGLGPRTSSEGRYVAVLNTQEELRPRKLQTVEVVLRDTDGQPVDGAQIAIDGGMPQHGHGLPTQPRVTKNLGSGTYVIEGVRFNMGGWWEFKLAIDGKAGSDTVTFNLAL